MMGTADKQLIEDEAVRWFVTLRDEDVTEDDRQRFEQWLSADPEHRRAWLEVERVWQGLDLLPGKQALPSVSPAVRTAPHRSRLSGIAAGAPRRASWRQVMLAACLALVLIASWQLVPVGIMADYRSGVGERQTVSLEDGSQIELGTSSAIDVNYNGERRTVKLLTGEAFFTVAKDPARPFVVQAGDGQVAVLGTAFNVKIEDGVTVAVTHNTVEVSAASDRKRVSEGNLVHYDGKGVSPVKNADLETVQAWRHDQLVFNDAPLNQVIDELQRYRHGRIQLLSREAGNLRVTAVFDTHRPDAALDTIAESLNLRVYRATNLLVAIAHK
jgi:transmembrane sensor